MTDTTRPEPCRSCGQPVIWAVTARQLRPIPVDPDPTPAGNIALTRRHAGRWRRSRARRS